MTDISRAKSLPKVSPGESSLTAAQQRVAWGKVFSVPGSTPVIFRGFTPQGWPLVNLERDPKGFGTLVFQDDRAYALVAAIAARYDADGDLVRPA